MMSHEMTYLVTGGAGYIGSVLVPFLLREGRRVRVLDVLMYGGESLLALRGHSRFELAVADIRDGAAVAEAVGGADIVVHLAAVVGEPACDKNPILARAVNLEGTATLLERARRAGASRFLFASTCSNYGAQEGLATEDSPLMPLSLYAETKIEAEKLVLAADGGGFRTTVMRFATAYGLSPRTRFDVMLNEFARDALLKGRLQVYNGAAWRPFAHVGDIARAVLLLAEGSQGGGQVFNVGGHNRRKRDLAAGLKELLPHLEIEGKAPGKPDPRDYRVDFGKLAALGFEPETTPEDGLAEILEALRAGLVRDPYEKRWANA